MEAGIQTARRPTWMQVVLIGRDPRRTLIRLLVLVTVSFIVFKFMLLPIRISGMSMFPTYKEKRVNFVNRVRYWFHAPQRYDVVAIRTSGTSIMYMKRIVGLPGESVGFHQGHVMINGKMLDEPYLKLLSDWEHAPERLGPDEYYLVGDNRSMALEDHYHGKAPRSRIVGKILL
jgi:signal peptidase I